jgi:hypothetical protein
MAAAGTSGAEEAAPAESAGPIEPWGALFLGPAAAEEDFLVTSGLALDEVVL